MLTTEFLSRDTFLEYGTWLKAQDPITLHQYFGAAIDPQAIDLLIEKFISKPKNNHFLIAKLDDLFWVGSIHIATHESEVEFGLIVALGYRQQGIADALMDEAITWARNCCYKKLFMHCISWNRHIQKLCKKYGLTPRNTISDSEANKQLLPPNLGSLFKEQMTLQRNLLEKVRHQVTNYRNTLKYHIFWPL